MGNTIQCPQCGSRYRNVPDQYLGKVTRCKRCHAKFRAEAIVPPEQIASDLTDYAHLTALNEDRDPFPDHARLWEMLTRIEAKLDHVLARLTGEVPAKEPSILDYDVPEEFGNLDM